MFGDSYWGKNTIKCLPCNIVVSELRGYPCTQTVFSDPALRGRYKEEYALSYWLNALKVSRAFGRCPLCKNGLARVEVPDVALLIMHFALSDPLIVLDPALNVTCGNHFTTRMIKENGDIWYHDGIETGVSTVAEGPLATYGNSIFILCEEQMIGNSALAASEARLASVSGVRNRDTQCFETAWSKPSTTSCFQITT
ncbi:hypothetical protein DFH08DRAFT_1029542 [Mycena albidolilacea]|uniref:Uncharacterized protein n=1 Tax=Mycena albidolilacea TaxID=1033008 RepID=A0AAD6ZIJ4_9AGAR|nr:hypothetical protein DFH08DRAFT_1029542 [Mycena albidolilacea]